ncbi:MAG: SRPBCC family protein [Gracilimonas sp.]|uniref:SRPBCC family protein n=1 Tax=Gracilimonas TaxID=649462 RepID=UPI001B0B9602|nr:SRPBCC family protein [Gracilimonas sp.]MBO6585624.1 SRPBCC family protein [Gracilimonas sp.]MBO6616621.1 SRPBCC family protein [Gracilimonas sp.]
MSTITVTKRIHAPKELVFKTVSDIKNFSKAVPDITNVEFLTEQDYGVGTKFRETRDMNGRKASTELEVTELVENAHIRIVSDTMGTIWDSLFTVEKKEDGTELTLIMDTKAYKLMSKIINPFMKGMMKKALEKDMDAVKNYCESNN